MTMVDGSAHGLDGVVVDDGCDGGDSAVMPVRLPFRTSASADSVSKPQSGRPLWADVVMLAVVFLGGALGTGVRYGLSLAFRGEGDALHAATFLANMVACFALALLSESLSRAAWMRRRIRDLANGGLGVGFCGGLSTLSTVMLEVLRPVRQGQMLEPMVYLVASMVCGVAVAGMGVWCARWIPSQCGRRVAVQDAETCSDGQEPGVMSGCEGCRDARVHADRLRAGCRHGGQGHDSGCSDVGGPDGQGLSRAAAHRGEDGVSDIAGREDATSRCTTEADGAFHAQGERV